MKQIYNKFKYSIDEFFYDKSFHDYPMFELFELCDLFLNKHQMDHFRLTGDDLLNNAKIFLRCKEFSNLTEDSFINAFNLESLQNIDTRNPRIITYLRPDPTMPLYPLLKIALIEISGIKNFNIQDYEYTYQTNTITIITYSSELFYE